MSEDRMFEVLHLDDQPQLVSWLPRGISSWFWKNCYEDMLTLDVDDDENDEETYFTLRLKACGERLDTHYHLFVEPADFEKQILALPPERVVLILLDQAIGTDFTAGTKLYSAIAKERPLLITRTRILSAYPNEVYEQLDWHPGDKRLIVKARTAPERIVAEFVGRLAESEQVGLGAKKQLAEALGVREHVGSGTGR